MSIPSDVKVGVVWAAWDSVHPIAEMARCHLIAYLISRLPSDTVYFAQSVRQPTAAACTELMVQALDAGCEWIFYLDDDVIPPRDTYFKLAEHADAEKAPVLSALAFFRYPPYWPSIFKYEGVPGLKVPSLSRPIPVLDYPRDQLVKVDATGLCACLMHRSVFEKIEKPWFDHTSDGTPDGWFMSKLWMADIPIHCHTGVIVGHLNTQIADQRTWDAWVQVHGVDAARSAALEHFRRIPRTPPGGGNGRLISPDDPEQKKVLQEVLHVPGPGRAGVPAEAAGE